MNQFLTGWNETLRKEKEGADWAIANLKEQNATLERSLEKEKSEFGALVVAKHDLLSDNTRLQQKIAHLSETIKQSE